MSTTAVTVAGAALGALALASCGATQAADVSRSGLTREAIVYAGDPWEKRFQKQFWSGQHLHDSWNRCHLGEHPGTGAGHTGRAGHHSSLRDAQAC